MRSPVFTSTLMLAAMTVVAVVLVWSRHPGGDTSAAPAVGMPASASPFDVAQLAAVIALAEPPADSASSAAAAQQVQTKKNLHAKRQSDSTGLGSELVERCLEVAREIDPELGSQLARKRDKNPQEFEQAIREGQVGRSLVAMVQLKQRDPDLYRLKISEMTETLLINRVAAQLQDALQSEDQGKIKALQVQLRTMVQTQMAMDLKRRGEYLCRIEEQVKTLREEIDHDVINFHKIVDARMKVLIEQPPSPDQTLALPAASKSR